MIPLKKQETRAQQSRLQPLGRPAKEKPTLSPASKKQTKASKAKNDIIQPKKTKNVQKAHPRTEDIYDILSPEVAQ